MPGLGELGAHRTPAGTWCKTRAVALCPACGWTNPAVPEIAEGDWAGPGFTRRNEESSDA